MKYLNSKARTTLSDNFDEKSDIFNFESDDEDEDISLQWSSGKIMTCLVNNKDCFCNPISASALQASPAAAGLTVHRRLQVIIFEEYLTICFEL